MQSRQLPPHLLAIQLHFGNFSRIVLSLVLFPCVDGVDGVGDNVYAGAGVDRG